MTKPLHKYTVAEASNLQVYEDYFYEDMGDMQKAQYFRQMYEKDMKQYPLRKSGVRQLSVPKM